MAASRDTPPSTRVVYIVDDDSMVRRSLSFSLATAGFATRAFASGRDFLDAVDSLGSGCVLLDIRMPDIDGIAVLDQLATRAQRFAVVAMTGHGDVHTAVSAMKRGAQDFIEKPFSNKALVDVLTTLFQALPAQADADAEHRDAIDRVTKLTSRERDVLRGMVAGQSSKTLAHELGIGIRTVEMHRTHLMATMGARSLADVVRIALTAGMSTADR
ncbi:response regulator transcription factor [Sphingomonas oligophenolica]|uniref:DNA-binding response regulator n=1 Tax=Sphingomonas oligophenolica TaxID=301154 RepID=A0A502CLP0_9SPHN|nr:response regulator [Sphingomonas oligophenolica]TPG14585.1 DNA-binding response regulator [Sphingomonas oligophenolica]